VSVDPKMFHRKFVASEPQRRDDFEEPPIRSGSIEPPVRADEPPPTKEELEAVAAEELLKIATDEERDFRNALRSKDSFIIFCPKGCRIRVKEQHRGRSGKCPRCQSEFVVPDKTYENRDEASLRSTVN